MSTAPTTVTEGVGMPDPGAIMQLGTAFWASKTLLSAVELGLFTELAANGPGDAEALRTRLGLHPRSARDFFDALVALGMLERTDGVYENTRGNRAVPRPRQADVRRRDARDAERAAVRVLELAHRRPATGEPQNEARTGDDFFAKLYADAVGLARLPDGDDRDQRRRGPRAGGRPFPGTSTRRSSTSAAPRAACPPCSPRRTRTCAAAASTCLPSGPSSRSTCCACGVADRMSVHRRRLLRRASCRLPT